MLRVYRELVNMCKLKVRILLNVSRMLMRHLMLTVKLMYLWLDRCFSLVLCFKSVGADFFFFFLIVTIQMKPRSIYISFSDLSCKI